eukprot:TRINITY_DN63789_c0_g1_i1.p1 TRINITY_DN63789_c0_g1~~TRINITY_DN63789_c0_g1_i1.p1  ORF type:complete len:279 (-),score=68.55 TRINITY_DN63789_c0_g1_i1:38-844(-)
MGGGARKGKGKSKGSGGKGAKGGGGGKGKGKSDGGAGEKGKAKGKGKGRSDVLTRKKRKQMMKQGIRPGSAGATGKGSGSKRAASAGSSAADGRPAKKRKAEQQAAAEAAAQERKAQKPLPPLPAKPVKCRRGHEMERFTANPKGYAKEACCDECGLASLAKKKRFFFHCRLCRWDLCPKCADDQLAAPKLKAKPEAETPPGSPRLGAADAAGAKGQKKKKQSAPQRPPEVTRARLLLQASLPTESTAAARAPEKAAVVSEWVEGALV